MVNLNLWIINNNSNFFSVALAIFANAYDYNEIVSLCEQPKNCIVTSIYNPLCGSNGKTYDNGYAFECIQECYKKYSKFSFAWASVMKKKHSLNNILLTDMELTMVSSGACPTASRQ